jgi:predicted dehydrogenase
MSTMPTEFHRTSPFAPAPPEIGVGVLGYRFMGKAHSSAYQRMPVFFWPPVARPRLVAICGRTEAAVAEAAQRYGYEGYYLDWRALVADPRIQLFDNCASAELHAEPTIAAALAGKHVICEKPLATSAADALRMWRAAQGAGVHHMTGFNYRLVPAVRYVRQLIEEGALGELYSFRGRYLQEGGDDATRPFTWRSDRSAGGYGALGDIGVHIIDLARYLMGEIAAVSAMSATFVKERPLPDRPSERHAVTVDDRIVAAVRFAGAAIGTLEASKVATGRKNQNTFEINGSRGSVVFDLERLNEIELYLREPPGSLSDGFRRVLVTEREHPFYRVWWPHGHIIGWEHSFVHEVAHMLEAIVTGRPIGPHVATFEDGYRALAVAEAMEESARTGRQVAPVYAGL